MSFQRRLDEERENRAEEMDAAVRAATERLTEARCAAHAVLPEVDEAVAALRKECDRSRTWLLSQHDPARTGNWGLGPDLAGVDRTRATIWSGPFREADFLGWWVRCDPFELVIPLSVPATVWLFGAIDRSSRPRESLPAFAETAIFSYRASSTSSEGTEEGDALSVDGLRFFVKEILEHLRDLPS
jgi:hypothetical protein